MAVSPTPGDSLVRSVGCMKMPRVTQGQKKIHRENFTETFVNGSVYRGVYEHLTLNILGAAKGTIVFSLIVSSSHGLQVQVFQRMGMPPGRQEINQTLFTSICSVISCT